MAAPRPMCVLHSARAAISGTGSSTNGAAGPHCPSNRIASSPPRSAARVRVRNQSSDGADGAVLARPALGWAPQPGAETVRIIAELGGVRIGGPHQPEMIAQGTAGVVHAEQAAPLQFGYHQGHEVVQR